MTVRKIVAAMAYTSADAVQVWSKPYCSGAEYPASSWGLRSVLTCRASAMEKPRSRNFPSVPMRMFSGLMPRCRIPAACREVSEVISVMNSGRTSSQRSRPPAWASRVSREIPSQYSATV